MKQEQPHTAICVRLAHDDDRRVVIDIAKRTIRSSYTCFLGAARVVAWLGSGAVEAYFSEHFDACRVMTHDRQIIGFAVLNGPAIDLLMIDHRRHRGGFGRALLRIVEAELFAHYDELRLDSFAANGGANAFYRSQGWVAGPRFDDPETGLEKITFQKQRGSRRAREPAVGP